MLNHPHDPGLGRQHAAVRSILLLFRDTGSALTNRSAAGPAAWAPRVQSLARGWKNCRWSKVGEFPYTSAFLLDTLCTSRASILGHRTGRC